jgi:general stress protein YciG
MAGKKGFQNVPQEHRAAISRKGGKAAHIAGTAHEFTPAEAKVAGSKGGKACQAKKRAMVGAAVKGITDGATSPKAPEAAEAIQEGDALSRSAMGDDSMSCGGHGGCGSSS